MTAHRLSADRTHRLYEALGNVAEATPMLDRGALVAVWFCYARGLPDTTWCRHTRGRLLGILPDLVRADWHWILRTLPDNGAADVLWQWVTGAGGDRATST